LLILAVGVLLWKSSKETVLVSSVMQSYSIACYEATGQTKWLRELVPGIDNGK
jgi:hypothetical protein